MRATNFKGTLMTKAASVSARKTTRRTLTLSFAAIVAVVLASCSPASGDKTAAVGKPTGTLHLYNWSDYIGPTTVADFTKETGIKVVYDTYDNNEIVETKLLTGGSGYDIAVPSNQVVARLISAKALAELDFSKLPNRKNLWPDITSRMEAFDPGLKHSIPYMWGTVGVAYNIDAIAKRLPGVPTDSWALAMDPANLAKLKDCGVMFLDSSEDVFPAVLNYLGLNPDSRNAADYAAATAHMEKLRPSIRKFHSSELINALATGDICLAVGYSGDMLQAKTRAEEAGDKVKLTYVLPKEGAQIWFDNMVIPADAPNPAAAHAFLDYIMRPDVIAKASDYVSYANANLASKALVDEAVRGNPNVYPSDETLKKLFVVTVKDQALLRDINRDWTKVRSGN
jgi:putrescine transport system substrate-binding protein